MKKGMQVANDDKDRDRHSETMIFMPGDPSIPPTQKQAFLTVVRGCGADLGQNQPIAEALVVGRGKECGLCLLDMQVSSRHARITLRPDGCYVLEDLGSTNGTRINGKALHGSWELLEGDKIFLGESVLRFAMADAMDLGYHHELSQLVRIDALTGLDSKRCFDDALSIALTQACRKKLSLSVLMMDMDGIKPINDTYGHLFGAHAIGETGRLIARVLHDSGRACRFGGDEFTAMLPGLDKAAAVKVGEEIRRLLEEARLEKDGIRLQPTISIGAASYPEDGETVLALIDAADRALYRAKRAGKNRVSV
jgi:diguanylate cyclase (GGDEF)-like protein